ncbi:MAG: hypothetical protein RL885_14460 [Planctomycetota bacterium]
MTSREATRTLEPLDVNRVAELHRLTDTLGDALWPGFDTRTIPVAVNHDDREEMLVAHPAPPPEFHPSKTLTLHGEPILVREGCTRYGPRGSGWAFELGGEQTAYVSTIQATQSTEDWLSALLHESFHVYQRRYQSMPQGGMQPPPSADAEYSARIGLESRVLQALIASEDHQEIRELGRQLIAVRRARYAGLTEEQIRFEGVSEYNEGTASYIQARLYQLLAARGGLEVKGGDPRYHGFSEAGRMYTDLVSKISPAEDARIDFVHGQYLNGMGLCLALDRLVPDWKAKMQEPGRRQYDLLESALAVAESEEDALLDRAEKRFEYEALLARQVALLDAHLAEIRSYLDAPGRRYRVHHGAIRGRFQWSPEGPVLEVPEVLITEPAGNPTTVWVGGMSRFEKGDLVFEGRPLPMIFRFDTLEWIDPEPAFDESDLKIAYETRDGDIYSKVRIETDGFVLTLPKARIVRTEERVDIHPVVD